MKRILSVAAALIIISVLAAFVHEGLHLFAAQALGISGRLKLWTVSPMFLTADPAFDGWREIVIGLAGGLGTGALLLAFWWTTARSKVMAELDNGLPLLAIGAGQVLYAPFDALLVPARSQWGGAGGLVIGLVLAGIYYLDVWRKELQ